MVTSAPYHLEELRIARMQTASERVMPTIRTEHRHILDVGCGAGQTLIAADLPQSAFVCGVDVDIDALALGRELSDNIHFVCASAEALPFKSGQFDFALSRVALPYTNIPVAVKEISRVLEPNGDLWLALHDFRCGLRRLITHAKRSELKGICFQLYCLANGVTLHLTGRVFPAPLRRGFESVQSRGGIERALRRVGITKITVERGRHFVVTAQKG